GRSAELFVLTADKEISAMMIIMSDALKITLGNELSHQAARRMNQDLQPLIGISDKALYPGDLRQNDFAFVDNFC
ncbi:MAG: hypothetical protein ACR2Q4_05890, partial [Geminicoccaceae bacterium]